MAKSKLLKCSEGQSPHESPHTHEVESCCKLLRTRVIWEEGTADSPMGMSVGIFLKKLITEVREPALLGTVPPPGKSDQSWGRSQAEQASKQHSPGLSASVLPPGSSVSSCPGSPQW